MKYSTLFLLAACLLACEPLLVTETSTALAQSKAKQKPKAKPADAKQPEYICPNHPEVTSNKEGKCRVCNGPLEKQETPVPLAGTGPGEIAALFKEINGYKADVLLTPIPSEDPMAHSTGKQVNNYRIDLVVMNTKTKKEVKDAEMWFHVVYPNGKNVMPKVERQRDNYAGPVYLPGCGIYQFMVHMNMKDGTKMVFNFKKVMH
jgi:hypothetical protein